MKRIFLVFHTSFDPDFSNFAVVHFIGAYDSKDKAIDVCNKDFCKHTHYKEIEVNKEVYIEI